MGIIQNCNFRLIPGFLMHSHTCTAFFIITPIAGNRKACSMCVNMHHLLYRLISFLWLFQVRYQRTWRHNNKLESKSAVPWDVTVVLTITMPWHRCAPYQNSAGQNTCICLIFFECASEWVKGVHGLTKDSTLLLCLHCTSTNTTIT